ncbi:MAG: RHS repeat-associated core domain-containing protein, partial [Herpetosiphonaceae bacterium]|nr:RHS repeat-associated core domain-containing protein [Herpetosiphonaceae bacterium]
HAVLTHNSVTVPYDANGNMLQDSLHTFTFNADNQPTTISYGSQTESYSYDAEGTRVTRTTSSGTTAYIGDLLEADVGQNVVRRLYTFNGRVWAQRTVTATSNTVQYLQSNYLGSVVGITDASGTLVDTMRYSPWGEQRNLTMSETTLNYTGQHWDSTALIYDHARYYNPAWGRFMSPDSIVPGMESGSGGAAATVGSGGTTPLTVDFHEPGFASQHNQHNADTTSMGFWFELSSNERRKAESPMGPANPQALNRYSYALNNPLRYTDPTGHCPWCVGAIIGSLGGLAYYAYTHQGNFNIWQALEYTVGGAVIGSGLGWLAGGGLAWLAEQLGEEVSSVPIGTDFGKLGTLVEDPGITRTFINSYAAGRLAQRGITVEDLDAWANLPTKVLSQSGGQKFLYITAQGAWVLDTAGRLVTAYSRADFDSNVLNVAKALGIIP